MNTSMTLCDRFTVIGKAINIHPDDDLCIKPDLLLLLALNGQVNIPRQQLDG